MSPSKKGTLRQVFICLRLRTPFPPPLTHCLRVNSILIHTGKKGGGRVEPERRVEGQQGRSQSWVENTNKTECSQEIGYLQSINSDKHLPQSLFTGQFFLDDDILHWLLWVLSFYATIPLWLLVYQSKIATLTVIWKVQLADLCAAAASWKNFEDDV